MIDHNIFVNKIIDWYLIHKRDLPWRHTTDPYLIWLSEIILQQTRVNQGLPYYLKFVETYATISDFADAPIDEILRIWQGLGYYSRARNMHFTANEIKNKHNGVFPSDYDTLIKLKGIGKYTASAISSFSINENKAVVDGNVYRVLSRFWGISEPINTTEGIKKFDILANEIINYSSNKAVYNQAIMEFGALHCKPQNPLCEHCELASSCYAYLNNETDKLPVKLNKVKIVHRNIFYRVYQFDHKIAFKKRSTQDIWLGLYDFFEVENNENELDIIYSVKHKLSHQNLTISFSIVQIKNPSEISLEFFSKSESDGLPKPVVVKNFIEKFSKELFGN